MVKVLNKVLLASCIVLLGGCTDNGLLFRSFGTYETNEDTITYKIGEPYQIKDVWYTPMYTCGNLFRLLSMMNYKEEQDNENEEVSENPVEDRQEVEGKVSA